MLFVGLTSNMGACYSECGAQFVLQRNSYTNMGGVTNLYGF